MTSSRILPTGGPVRHPVSMLTDLLVLILATLASTCLGAILSSHFRNIKAHGDSASRAASENPT